MLARADEAAKEAKSSPDGSQAVPPLRSNGPGRRADKVPLSEGVVTAHARLRSLASGAAASAAAARALLQATTDV